MTRRDWSLRKGAPVLLLIGAALIPCPGWSADEGRHGPWNLPDLRQAPTVQWLHRQGPARSLYYSGEPYHEKPTRIFAYYAVPERRRGRVPAMVLVHGGGGRAFPQWAAIWAQRGYAAIAMDLSGRGPGTERHADAGPDQTDEVKFFGLKEGIANAWVYHAVAAVIRAVSFLRTQPEVDPDRIGITGISWGGYLTSLVVGLDDRIKVAIPVYGCGFLHKNSYWLPIFAKMPADLRATWIENFDPSQYLAAARMPILWINGTNDFAYPLDSYQASYRLPQGPRWLRITVNMPHGHAQGWEPLEICAFADQYLRGGTPLAKIERTDLQGANLTVTFQTAVPIIEAALHYTRDTMQWDKRKWETVSLAPAADTVTAQIPPERPITYFVTLTDMRGAIVSSEHREIPGAQ